MALTEDQINTLTWTVLGEAGGESVDGQAAVAHVIKNRSESGRFSKDPAKVAKQRKQFSTWNAVGEGGNNPQKYSTNSDTFKRTRKIVEDVFGGNIPDPTGGATHYWSPRGMEGGKDPSWAASETVAGRLTIGNHVFLPRNSASTQNYTSSGEGVQRLQSELKRMGFDPGEVDGVMGSRTKSAIKEFQKANGLKADGIVGPQTATVLSAMGGGNVSVPGSQNWRNVSGVAPAGVSISPGYNPNVGIGDSGNAAMSVTPRVPTANFRNPADPTLNNISPEQAKGLSRGLDMNVSREQSAKDVLIGGFGALLGKTFPMGSAPASGALTSVSRPTYIVNSNGDLIDRTTGAKVGQSEPSFANTNLSTLRRQIGFTDASRVAPAVPAPKPALPKLTGFGGMTGTSSPRPASFPATTNTVRTDGTVVSGVGGAGQVRTSQIPEGYRPASALPYTPASIFSAPLRLTGPGGMTGTSPPKFIPPVYSSASPSIPIPLPRTARPATPPIPLPRNARPLPASAPLSFAAIKPAPPAPTKLTGFGAGTSFPSAAPIPLPRNARPVALAGTALAATENVAGLKPASRNVSSYSGGSSSRSGSSSPAPIEGSATGKLYNVGQTYTTGGGLKYVAQADGSFKKV